MKLANIWSDGIIIQQQKKIRIWGKADAGELIHIKFMRNSVNIVLQEVDILSDNNGQFLAELNPLRASFEAYTLIIKSNDQEIRVNDILVGEVWLSSGQSNMALPVDGTLDKDKLLKQADNNKIRFIVSPGFGETKGEFTERPFDELFDIPFDNWKKADNEDDVKALSCISFAFAIKLFEELNVPIGIISTAVGGTTIEAWLARDVIKKNKSISNYLKSTYRYIDRDNHNKLGGRNYTQMCGLFNEKIAPITNLNIRGTIWLQGESSAGEKDEAKYYKNAFDLLIKDWNKRFRYKNQPFIFSHIANQNYQFAPLGVAYINEAFNDVYNKNSGYAFQVPIYDIPLDWKLPGDLLSHPIHTVIKAPIGERMAELALSKVYKINSSFDVPVLKSFYISGDKIILKFDGVCEGLNIRGSNTLRGFTICGNDGKHIDAIAKIISSNEVEVYNENIDNPKGVTYAFSSLNQFANLINSAGVPAVPFRTGRKKEIYYNHNLWMSCDYDKIWVNCFEWTLGGAEYKPLWKGSTLSGTQDVNLSFDKSIKSEGESSLKAEYIPDFETGCFIGLSPVINHVANYHQMDSFDYLTFDIKNPDDRTKLLVGILIKTVKGKVYLLPIEENGEYKPNIVMPANSGFITYKASLKNFLGCYLINERKTPSDLSDVTDLQFTFRDEKSGTIFIDNIRFGWDK